MATAYPQSSPSANLSRLITAAVINQSFCRLLLTNPEKAINTGYNGETFRLDRDEKDLVLSIQANSLADFAVKLSNQHHPAEKSKPRISSRPMFPV
ncbi:MAG TPA: hypothetical protein VHO48_09185 [Anaerolineaceae bacterium]|jgi:hypothetical protein|nr:hypothetical protein [Anaerolineaceae bacterium]